VADVAPTLLARDLVGEQHLPGAWLASLRRHRWTSGYFRLDVDLDGPAPWADERLRDSAVVHVTGDLDELAMSQAQVRRGRLPELPQLIVGSRTAPTRPASARRGQPVGGVPLPGPAGGEDGDWAPAFAERVLDRLEAHAPGLRERVVDTTVVPPWRCRSATPTSSAATSAAGSASPDQLRRLPARRRLVAVRPAGARAVDVRAASHPGGGVHGCAAQRRPARCCGRAAQALGA
jgi:phytoene dehydrogenase-like protein